MIRTKRVYLPKEDADGFRVLVERLWPRGLTKEKAAVDLWLKEIAPSPGLRTWYAHDPAKWAEFQKRYRAELTKNPAVGELVAVVKEHRKVTLVFASSEERNSANVLAAYLNER